MRERAFALLDRAQIDFAVKPAAWHAFDGALDQSLAELTALDLPAALRDALVELLVANPA